MPTAYTQPFFSLRNALDYINNTAVLDANIDMLSDLVAHHSYTGHPDDECNYENSMRGDLECYYLTCVDIQERYEELVIMFEECPNDDNPAKLESITEELNEYKAKYGGDRK